MCVSCSLVRRLSLTPPLAPPMFRRRAVAHMATDDKIADGLMFPFRQNVRLILTLTHRDALGVSSATNTVSPQTSQSLDDELKSAQAEIVEQEIFTLLVSEAANLPSVSAQVSERLIVLEAAQGTELKFELVRCISFSFHSMSPVPSLGRSRTNTCSGIFSRRTPPQRQMRYHLLHTTCTPSSPPQASEIAKAGD